MCVADSGCGKDGVMIEPRDGLEQRILDAAAEDYIQLWELAAPVTEVQQNDDGTVHHVERHEAPSRDALAGAVGRLLEAGKIVLVRRVGDIELTPIVDAEGTFATVGEVFPSVADTDQWWLPIQVVLIDGIGQQVSAGG
jgi:hypothetical protein